MPTYPLPVNIDATYADSGTDASQKLHQQYHDQIHGSLSGAWANVVADFGASTGATASANRIAMQNAINAVGTAGGGVVFIPAGTYTLDMAANPTNSGYSHMLYLPSNVILRGAGQGATVLFLAANATGNTKVYLIGNKNVSGSPRDVDMTVEHLTLDGNAANQHTTTQTYNAATLGGLGPGGNAIGLNAHGIGWLYAERCKVLHVTVRDNRGTSASGSDTEMFAFVDQNSHDCEYIGARATATGTTHIANMGTTSGSATVTSASFTAAMDRCTVKALNVPDQTILTSIVVGVSAVLSNGVGVNVNATATGTNIVASIGRTASGLASNYSTNIKRVHCRADRMSIGMGFTDYHSSDITNDGCSAILNASNGFNEEFCYNYRCVSCTSGGRGPDIVGANNPVGVNEDRGNKGSGFVFLGGTRPALVACHSTKNGSSARPGQESGINVTADTGVPLLDGQVVSCVIADNVKNCNITGTSTNKAAELFLDPSTRGTMEGATGGEIYNGDLAQSHRPTGFVGGSVAVSGAATITIPAAGTARTNQFPFGCWVEIVGGNQTSVEIDAKSATLSTVVGRLTGAFMVPHGGKIRLVGYTTAPSWKWFAAT